MINISWFRLAAFAGVLIAVNPVAHSQPMVDRLDDLIVYFEKEDASPNEILRLANKVISIEGKCEAFWRRGWAYSQLGRHANAISDYSKSIEYGCSNGSWIWYEIGYSLYAGFDHRYEESINAFNKAVALDKKDPNIYQVRGYVHLALDEVELACGDFKAASELGYDDPESHLSLKCSDVVYTSAYNPIDNIPESDEEIFNNSAELPHNDLSIPNYDGYDLTASSDEETHDDGVANESDFVTQSSEAIAEDGHDMCLQASDYKGCMEYQEGSTTRITETGSEPGTVDVTEPKPYNYDPESVMQLKIRGSYGRYLTFIGKTVNEYAGTSGYMLPGSPGSVSCNTYGGFGAYSSSYTTCSRSGYVAPTYVPGTSGGVQNRKYRYELDCQDMTFDRKGDYAGGVANKGWMSVDNDPTAQAVANRYCSSIGSLPRAAER